MFAFGQRPNFSLDQPLPHQPQAHFHGLPAADLNFSPGPQPGIAAGERGYACTLDTLATCGDRPSMVAENVLLVGSEGALDVYKVGSDGSAKIGTLQGLRGAVIDARILPWTFREDIYPRERPLVGLVIHGPMLSEAKYDNIDAMDALSSAVYSDDGRSPSPAPQVTAPSNTGEITHYQTTVEIYSLKSGRHIASLLQCPPVPLVVPVINPVFEPPSPVGELSLNAKGKFITVASGSTGEIFVFSCYKNVSQKEHSDDGFRLVGKFWTSLQYRENQVNSPLINKGERRSRSESQEAQGIPTASLSHRWLAIIPPSTSSIYSLNATILLADPDRGPPGFNTHAAPPQPSVTCAVDAPDGNGFLNWVAREVTQEVIKGARWVGEQGVQAWKTYWNKGPQPGGANVSGDGASVEQQQQQRQHQQQYNFPPTHGNFTGHGASPAGQPTLVAIYDLQRLLDAEETRNKNANAPIATFPVPLGCSFLSFSPHGLWLMTVSKKGDCQFVWDLMRMRHGRPRIMPSTAPVSPGRTANPLGSASPKSQLSVQSGPHVRQIALFTRMTVARVVDISWSAPKGNLFSILTEKGTIHIFEIPQSAFQWPAPRPSRKAAAPSATTTEAAGSEKRTGISPAATFGAVSSAVQAINGSTRPFISKAMRLRSSSGGSGVSGGSGGSGGSSGIGIGSSGGIPGLSSLTSIVPAAGAARNSKAVVTAGLSKSLGVASDSVNSIRHAGDNKLHLSVGTGGARPGRVRWQNGRGHNSIAVIMVGSSGSSGGTGTNTIIRTYGVGRYSTFDVNNAHPSTGVSAVGTSGMAIATNSGTTAVKTESRSGSSGSKKPRSWAVITKARPTEQKVPDIPDLTLAPAILAYLDHVQSGENAGEHLLNNGERLIFTDAEGNTKLRSIAAWAMYSPVSPSNVPGLSSPDDNSITSPESRSRPFSSTAAHGGGIDNTHVSIPLNSSRPHNLSFAEIDSNPPYQPFHTDRRVSLIAYTEPLPPSVPVIPSATDTTSATVEPWAFGQPIPGRRLQTGHGSGAHKTVPSRSTAAAGAPAGTTAVTSSTARNGAVQSTMTTTTRTMIDPNTLYSPGHNDNESYKEGMYSDTTPTEQIVVTSRRLRARPGRRSRKGGDGGSEGPGVHNEGQGASARYNGNDDVNDIDDDDGFFEDDCEVLDFATDRV